MKKIKLAVFDLDGTVLDTLDDLSSSVNFALKENGYPERTKEEIRRFVGNGILNLIKRSMPDYSDKEAYQPVFTAFKSHYAEHCADMTKPYDGTEELLGAIRSKGIKTALISNKSDGAVQSLAKTYFDGLFDYIAGEKDGIKRKPAPDGVNIALEQLGISKNEAVYIGDSEVDITTAINAKMPCISVTWGFRSRDFLKENGAGVIADNIKELENYICR